MYRNTTIIASLLALVALGIIIGVGLEINQLLIFKAENNDQAININRILLNLSYSYITGYIVYMLTVFLPETASVHKIKPVIIYKFSKIENAIDDCVKIFCYLSSIKTGFPLYYFPEELSQQTQIDYDCKLNIEEANVDSLQKILSGEKSKILFIIEQLIEYRDYLSSDGLKLLEEIRHSEFFGNIYSLDPYGKNHSELKSKIKYLFKSVCFLREIIKKDKQHLF